MAWIGGTLRKVKIVVAVLAWSLLVAFLAATVLGWTPFPPNSKPGDDDAHADAEIVGVREDHLVVLTFDDSSSGVDIVYYPTVSFDTADGRPIETESRCYLHDEPPVGNRVDVFYPPDQPRSACVTGGSDTSQLATLYVGLTSIFIGLIAVFATFVASQPDKPAAVRGRLP